MDSPTDFLMEKSELQIHLLSSSSSSSSPSPQECALQLLHTQLSCSILVEAVGTLGPLPLVNTKVMDRELGTCEPREQGERGVSLQGGAEQQVLLYSARCSSFSRVVSDMGVWTLSVYSVSGGPPLECGHLARFGSTFIYFKS